MTISAGLFVLALILVCGAFFFFVFVSYPSTKAIGNQYLRAVTEGDLEAAVRLANQHEDCREWVAEAARQDIKEFGGDEIRNVSIQTEYNDGSDDELQFAEIEFEHRDSDQAEWQVVSMRLTTDYDVPGFRYLCGRQFRTGQ